MGPADVDTDDSVLHAPPSLVWGLVVPFFGSFMYTAIAPPISR